MASGLSFQPSLPARRTPTDFPDDLGWALFDLGEVKSAWDAVENGPAGEAEYKRFCVALRKSRSDLIYMASKSGEAHADAALWLAEAAEAVLELLDSRDRGSLSAQALADVRDKGIGRHRDILRAHLQAHEATAPRAEAAC